MKSMLTIALAHVYESDSVSRVIAVVGIYWKDLDFFAQSDLIKAAESRIREILQTEK